MKFVEPIRDKNKISQIKNQLRGAGMVRDLLLFELGINSALRISDLLGISIGDVIDEQGEIVDFFEVSESKTDKKHRVTITNNVRRTLELYKDTYPLISSDRTNYLFFNSRKDPIGKKHIIRQHARKLINKWCEAVGLKGNYGGHTLRKTRGFQARKGGIPMEIIQEKLNHSSMKVTKRYLGITDDEIQEACMKLDL